MNLKGYKLEKLNNKELQNINGGGFFYYLSYFVADVTKTALEGVGKTFDAFEMAINGDF